MNCDNCNNTGVTMFNEPCTACNAPSITCAGFTDTMNENDMWDDLR